MSFTDTVDAFSYAAGYLVSTKMSSVFADVEIDEFAWNKAMFDASKLFSELNEMGHPSAINASLWAVANATFFFSPLSCFNEHMELVNEVYEEIINYGDVVVDDTEVDEDAVFEFTSDKEHLMNCFNKEAVSSNN